MPMAMLCLWSRPKLVAENHGERQANTHILEKFSHHVLHTDSPFCLLLDAASHCGVVGKHQSAFPIPLFRIKRMASAHSILTFSLLFAF